MEYKLLLAFFLPHLITSLPVDEDDDYFYDDDDDDDTSPVDFSTLESAPQIYQVELEDIKLLNQLVETIAPEFFALKQNGTICGLSHLEENPESDRIVDTFYIRTLAGTNKKLIEILEYYELNNQLPEELPHSAFIESIWDLVDCKDIEDPVRNSRLRRSTLSRKKRGTGCMGRDCTFDTRSSIIRPIFGYGCWCNFGDMFGKGGGKPKDAFDRSCKQLQRCVRCTSFDDDENGNKCKFRTANFNSKFITHFQSFISCDDLNAGNPCGVNICKCEELWMNNVFGALWGGATFDNTYVHKANNVVNFESVESFTNNAGATRYRPHSTNCARPQTFCGAGDDQICKGHRQCCGVYPERFPYSANKKQKHCCNKGEDGGIHEVLINTDKFACCADKGKIGNVTEVSDWEFTQLKNTCAGNTLPKPTWVAP